MRTQTRAVGTCLATALLAVPLLAPATAGAQEKDNPIVALVKGAVKDRDRPFTLVVALKVKKGDEKKLEAAFAGAIKATRKEKGCLVYDLNRDASDPTRYEVYERWQSIADLEAHLNSGHIKALLAELGGLLDGAPMPRVLLPAAE